MNTQTPYVLIGEYGDIFTESAASTPEDCKRLYDEAVAKRLADAPPEVRPALSSTTAEDFIKIGATCVAKISFELIEGAEFWKNRPPFVPAK